MKKRTAFFVFCALLPSTFASAEELVVDLKSGNSIIIEYTGTIAGVSMIGETDAIKTMTFQNNPKNQTQQITTSPKAAGSPPETTEANDHKSSWIRMKMAEPLAED